jgi:hypothetical protein
MPETNFSSKTVRRLKGDTEIRVFDADGGKHRFIPESHVSHSVSWSLLQITTSFSFKVVLPNSKHFSITLKQLMWTRNCYILQILKALFLTSSPSPIFNGCQRPIFKIDFVADILSSLGVKEQIWSLMRLVYERYVHWIVQLHFKVWVKVSHYDRRITDVLHLDHSMRRGGSIPDTVTGLAKDLLENATPQGKIVNGLDFPMWKDTQWDRRAYATDMVAWDHLLGSPHCGTITTPYPTGHMRWG